MIVGVPRESYPGERRVASRPERNPSSRPKSALKSSWNPGAGVEAGYPDMDYTKGAKVISDRAEIFRTADIIVQVLSPAPTTKPAPPTCPFRRDKSSSAFSAR